MTSADQSQPVQIRFIFHDNSFADVTMAPGTLLPNLVGQIRLTGYFCSDSLYVPVEAIQSLLVVTNADALPGGISFPTPAKPSMN